MKANIKIDLRVLKWTKRKIERHKDKYKDWLTCVKTDKAFDSSGGSSRTSMPRSRRAVT